MRVCLVSEVTKKEGKVVSLQNGIPVEAQLVLDHAVGDLLGHLALGHLVAREVLGGEARAVDGGREAVLIVAELQMDLLDAVGQLAVDLLLRGDA